MIQTPARTLCAGRTADPIVRQGRQAAAAAVRNSSIRTIARKRNNNYTNKNDTRTSTMPTPELMVQHHHCRPIRLHQQVVVSNNTNRSYRFQQHMMMTNNNNHHSIIYSRPLSSNSNNNSNSSNNSTSSTKDPNALWQNWFQSDEYRPLWQTPPPPPPQSTSSPSPPPPPPSSSSNPSSSSSSSTTPSLYLQPLPNLPLDNASQFTLSLLSDMTYNIRRGTDLATSQRCNHILRRLIVEALVVEKEEEGTKGNRDSTMKWCYAERAYMVWKAVEVCYDAVQKRHTSSSSSLKMYEPPRLDRDVYIELTNLYATAKRNPGWNTTGVERDTAERIQEIVTTMSDRYYAAGNLDLRPNVVLWNRVIGCWASSDHCEKSHRAASIVRSRLGGGGSGGTNLKADLSSYGHVLKACATSNREDERARRLGAEIAVMVWKELEMSGLLNEPPNNNTEDNDNDDDDGEYDDGYTIQDPAPDTTRRRNRTSTNTKRRSDVFVFAMRSMDLVYREKTRNGMIQKQLDLCKKLGLVNNHVLHAFVSVASSSLVKSQLQNIVDESGGGGVGGIGDGSGTNTSSSTTASRAKQQQHSSTKTNETKAIGAQLFRQIPAEWKRNIV